MMELGFQKITNFMIDNIYRLIATLAQIFFQVVKTKNVFKLSTVVNVFLDDLGCQRTCIKKGIQDSILLYTTKKSI